MYFIAMWNYFSLIWKTKHRTKTGNLRKPIVGVHSWDGVGVGAGIGAEVGGSCSGCDRT